LNDPECRRIIVRAPVKCGKREMVEYIAQRDSVEKPTRVHAFLSAWHRKADDDQREELSTQNMKVFSITTQKKVEETLAWIDKQQQSGKSIVLHLDECDHGSASKQLLSKVWQAVHNIECITTILYSATPEEVLYSEEMDNKDVQAMMDEIFREAVRVEYDPPKGYCGPTRFLQEGLVHEALPFFFKEGNTFALSQQGKKIVSDLRSAIAVSPSRNIVVLRLSSSEKDKNNNRPIYQFLRNIASFPELSDFLIVVDKPDDIGIKNSQITAEKIQWSVPNYWRRQSAGVPILIVIDKTSSRSTEWACHDRVFATHDFRNVAIYSTISQAQERVNHYEQRYGGFQPIQVYGHTRTFKLSAKQISYASYLNDEWKKRKIDARRSPVPMFHVHSTATGHTLHPRCPEVGLTEGAAICLLQELGCYAKISISPRVIGSVRVVPTYALEWKQIIQEEWEGFWEVYRKTLPVADSTRSARNPFDEASRHRLDDGTWQGQHRGWKVLECVGNELYQRLPGGELKKLDIGSTGGNRNKVCYKDGVLGVAIVSCTGTEMIDTLHSFKSMYGN
jgi:hypothetical protein